MVRVQLFLERRDEFGHGLFAGVKVALGCLVQFAQCLAGQTHQLRLSLLEGIGAECLERLLQLRDCLVIGLFKGSQLRLGSFLMLLNSPLGRRPLGLGTGALARAQQPADDAAKRRPDQQPDDDFRIIHEPRKPAFPSAS